MESTLAGKLDEFLFRPGQLCIWWRKGIHQIKAVKDTEELLFQAFHNDSLRTPKMELQTKAPGAAQQIAWPRVQSREVNRDAAAACADYSCSRHTVDRVPIHAHCSWAAIRLGSFLLSAALALCVWSFPQRARGEVVCADDLVPEGMAVTATGTSANCAGACRAREIMPVCGPVFKICAGQPIPKGYALDGVTTMPNCACLGSGDNGLVIRYIGYKHDPVLDAPMESAQQQQQQQQRLEHPYGDPPFGNLLCASNPLYGSPPAGGQPYGGVPSFYGNGPPPYAPPYGSAGLGAPAGQPSPIWNDQPNEPFRVGQ